MSDLAAGYIQNLAQDEGEQLKDALDKTHQLEQAHYREAQKASQGNKYFGDSPSHKNILASVSQRARTAAMERTLPKGEVNEEALLRDFLEPSDMERAIAAELAKVDQEILGGRNESMWTDYANFGKGVGKELGRFILNLSGVTQQVMYDVGHLEQAREDLSRFGRRLGQGLQQSSYIAQQVMYDIGHPEQGMEDMKSLYSTGKEWLQEFSAVGAEQKGEIIGQAAVTAGSFLAGGELLGAGAAGLASRFAMFGRAAEVGEVGAQSISERNVIRQRVLANIAESRAARKASYFKIHALIEQTRTLDVNTALDEAVFWSGPGNRELADVYSVVTEKATLEMTPGGRYMELQDLFKQYPYEQAIKPWERLSERFAGSSSGMVSAFVEGATENSIFNRIEYPTLLNNPNVDEIIFSPEFEYQNAFRP